MNVLTDIWRQLVRRRLWPLALLLLVALVAAPVLLTKHPSTSPPPATPAADDEPASATAPAKGLVVLTSADDTQSKHHHSALGAPKDPFKPAPLPKPKPVKTPAPTDTPAPSAQSEPSTGGTGGSSGATTVTTPTPATPAPATTPTTSQPTEKKVSYPKGSVTVRFGGASDKASAKRTVQRLQPLPSAGDPVLVYLGLRDKGKTAAFMVGDGIDVQGGDGTCHPNPDDCQTLRLHAGDTEFLATPGQDGAEPAKYELDLLKIH